MAKPKFEGSALFYDQLTITIKGENYILWINDPFHCKLGVAEKNREILLLKEPYVSYGEAMTGYIDEHDYKPQSFSFKHRPDSWISTVIPYDDVIAWGYVDQAEFKNHKEEDD